MSMDLYLERLYWNGYRGAAKAGGISVELTACPVLHRQTFEAIDFAPETFTFLVRPAREKERDMTMLEIAYARVFLDKIAHGESL